jgi:ribonuclease P protein component
LIKGHQNEKNLSTEQHQAQADARLPRPDGDAGRAERAEEKTGQRTQTTDGHGAAEAASNLNLKGCMGLSQGGESFPRRARLTKRSEFLTLSRHGRRVHTSHFVVLSKVNGMEQNRLGITVTTRVGNAVVRNRIKRLLRESFRRWKEPASNGQDIVVIAKRGAEMLSLSEVAAELQTALTQGRSRQR